MHAQARERVASLRVEGLFLAYFNLFLAYFSLFLAYFGLFLPILAYVGLF